jgi:pilus assembly protein CpaC
VIIVTPHLAKPMNEEDIILPTDSFIEPTDAEFYLMGRLEGKPRVVKQKSAATSASAEQMAPADAETEEVSEQTLAEAELGHQIQ